MTDQPTPDEVLADPPADERTAEELDALRAAAAAAHVHDFPDGLPCSCGAELVEGEGGKLDVAHPAEGLGEANADLEEPTDTERLQASRTELADHAIELHAAGETDAGDPSVDVGADADALFRAQGYIVLQGAVKQAAQAAGQLAPDTIKAVIDATFKAIAQAKVAGDRHAEVALGTDLAAYRALLRFRQELTKVDEGQRARARLLGLDVAQPGPPNGRAL